MIAFLPSDGSWCRQDFPHMTLVFGGMIDEQPIGDFNALIKDAISAGRITGAFSLPVVGIQQLGQGTLDNPIVDALVFHPTPQLLVARSFVEKWNKSEFKNFLPHASIGPTNPTAMNNEIPSTLYFNKVAACWGDQRAIFSIDF